MAKKNNVIEEIQELIRQIKNEYTEEIDFKTNYHGKVGERQKEYGAIEILSPCLRKFFREKFNFPLGSQNIHHLDYHKRDQLGNNYYYRIKDIGENDTLYWQWNRKSELDEPKKCRFCSELTFQENGRMWLWDGKTVGKEFGQDSKVIGHFHPECAKKYFADKEQPSENNIQIKEKLLRNLDKICLDPMGELANAELLKQKGTEKNYNTNNYANIKDKSKPSYDNYEKWLKKVHTVEIEGEKIWLSDYSSTSIGSLGYQEVKKALMQEIKQNPSEWEITEREEDKEECEGGNYIIKHKSGRRHWDSGFYRFWGITNEYEKMGKEWDKIKSSLKGYKTPTGKKKINNTELENLKRIFKAHNIKKISFKNGELVITHNNNNNNETITNDQLTNNFEYQLIKNSLSSLGKNELTSQELGINSENTSNNTDNSSSGNKYLWLGGVITLGIIISAILVFSLRRKKRKIN